MRKVLIVGLAVVGLAGCGSTKVNLTYNPTGVVKPEAARPMVEVINVADDRKNASPRIGAIRGGFGNPLKTLDASVPVNEMVRQAFADGLTARGMLAAPGSAQYGLNIGIKRLDSSQLMRREAHAHFDVAVATKGGAGTVFQRTYTDDRSDSGDLATGVLADVEDLRKITNDSLQAAVDKALDDPAFVAAISGPAPIPLASTAPASTSRANSDRLRELQALYDQHLITKGEYEERRRVILGGL